MYSSRLFLPQGPTYLLEQPRLCFVENIPLKPYEDRLGVMIVYYWNRTYPADTYLDINLNLDWEITETKEFGGNSHEKITRKIYKRKNQ